METLYTCDAVAEYFRIKKVTVYSWIKDKQLPAIKINDRYLVKESDLNAFLKSHQTVQNEDENGK